MPTSKATKATKPKHKGRGGARKNSGKKPTLFNEKFTPFLVKLTEADQEVLKKIQANKRAAGIYTTAASLIREGIQKLKTWD